MNISRTVGSTRGERERGWVAVELAMILMGLGGILAITLAYGHIFWQYSVATNAAYGATRYMAASGQWTSLDTSEKRQEAAKEMFKRLAADSGMDVASDSLTLIVDCPAACTTTTFDKMTLNVASRIPDPFGVWPDNTRVSMKSVAVNPN